MTRPSAVDVAEQDPRPGDGGHLTASQAAAIERYIRRLLRRLDLNYWRVAVSSDLPPEGAWLRIEPVDGRRFAMLLVSEHWWAEQSATEKRTDLTHECLHLAHHDQEEVIRRFKNTTGDVNEYAMSIVWEQFRVETERMVDSLSYVLAPHMPAWKHDQ